MTEQCCFPNKYNVYISKWEIGNFDQICITTLNKIEQTSPVLLLPRYAYLGKMNLLLLVEKQTTRNMYTKSPKAWLERPEELAD